MGLNIRKGLFMIMFVSLLFAVACSSDTSDNNTNNEQEAGGTLNIAVDASPPSLDQPTSTATNARDTSRLIFESLVTTDSEFSPVPMLAESIETEDNQTFTFHLRQGILFHNGEEMIAEDVIASMERWLEKSSITGNIFNGATWTAEDDYTVVLELQSPSALVLDTIATSKQGAAIMPKEIVDSAPAEGVTEYIGTGPYKFVEWQQDNYIKFEKYEDYQPLDMEPDGLAGKREALVDEIYFHIVTDPSTRLTGLQTGEYDFVYGVPLDNYEQLQNDPNLETILEPEANNLLGLNNVEGPASDFKLRQAINTALDAETIMMAGYPNEDFYWLDSGYMDVHIANWASTAGSEYYNQNDMEKAKQLLEESEYDGEEFTIITTRDYFYLYNIGVVIQEQLKQLGMNVKLEVYDWPTMLDLRDNKLSEWDGFITSSTTVSTPPQLLVLSSSWAGGVNDDFVGEAMKAIETAPTIEEAHDLWDDLQLYVWEELLPAVQLGGNSTLYGSSSKVQGIETTSGPIFWNVTVSE
ncbi:ABC transporter substrate-binding protein [Ornithinibacillus sp. 4-3]|uniref:ABC transporter substrate-binding protein n=1 Tax=Ornithinibacillus sp. 4-3 TaxID=3231488 RepID=A0AB39HPX1_9BACI